MEWPLNAPPMPDGWNVPLFSAASLAADSPFSWVGSSLDLKPGDGEAAVRAAWAGVSVDLDMAVAPSTPPKTMAAAATDARTRVRVLIIGSSLRVQPQNGLGIRCEFGGELLLPAD